MRVNLILPKNNKLRRYQKQINEDYLKGVKPRETLGQDSTGKERLYPVDKKF
ncbi:MAG TPA: hypothetical protein VIW25_08330 [Nitrososphaeraceae archaeon]|jgi:hypothetical protein